MMVNEQSGPSHEVRLEVDQLDIKFEIQGEGTVSGLGFF